MAVDLDIFAIDSTIHGFNGKKKKGSDQDEIAGGNNLTDLFSILEEEKNEKQHTGDIGNQNCVPNSSDNLHPFFMLDDEDGNIRDETKKSNDDMIDIFALDNDQQQSHPIKCIDFNDAKYNRGKRESIASLEHYNADFIAYFSDDTTEDFEYYAKNLEEPQDLSTELFNLEPNQNLSDEEVLDRSSGDYADDEHDKSFKIHDDNEEEEQDTSIILETTDDSKSDTVSESSDIYTVEEEEYYNGSDTSTIESSDVEESAEEEVRQVMEKQEETADEDREDSDVQEESTSSEDAPEHEHAWWLKDDVVIMLFPGDSMKIRTLNDLLPDFQNFLDDLCQIKLTSDLEDKAKDYRQRISDYIEQFSSQPGQVPPPLPETSTSTFQLDPDVNLEDLLAKERDKSRLNFASSTLPTLNGHTTHGEFTSEVVDEVSKRHSMPPGFRLSKRLSGHFLSKRRSLINEPPGEDFYEAPMDQKPTQKPPPVPDSVRPVTTAGIVRQIDDLPTYDDPDSPQNPSPPPVTGLPPRLPNSNQGYHVLNPEGQDSGGTFSTGTETTGHFSDDGELYEDLNEDDDSFSDGYDSDELEPINPDPEFVSGKTKTKKKDKDDSYWQNFVNFIESENNTCDHKGKLYFYDAKSTLNKLFKPKVYFCAATNARLLCYLPKKEYGKPQIDIPLQSSCEISSTGKDGGKEYGIQVQVKKGKVYSFNCTTSLEADKWVETLKKYTNQGLEYDVTPCTGDSGDGEVVSPPPGMEDPMFSKIETIMKRVFKNKKNKKHSPQITEEDGAVHGYANVLGAFYGEPKWQKKWIVIKNHQFSCHKSKSDDYEFAFSLKDVELGAPEQKIVKKGREGALKFSKDNETLIYLEALNPLDVGKIMKQALNAMMVSSAATKGNLVRRETTVEKITKFYEALEQGVTEQPGEDQALYINTQIGGSRTTATLSTPDSDASTPGVQDGRLYVNTQIGGASTGRNLSAPVLPSKSNDAEDDDIYEDTDNVVESPPNKESKSKSLPWGKKKEPPLPTKSNDAKNDELYLDIYDDADNVVESPPKQESKTMSLPWGKKKASPLPTKTNDAEDDDIYDDTDNVSEPPPKKDKRSSSLPWGKKKESPLPTKSNDAEAEEIYDDTDNVVESPPTKESKSMSLPWGKKKATPLPTKSIETEADNIYDDTDNVVESPPPKQESKSKGKGKKNPFARRKKDSTDDKKELDEEPEEEPPKKGDKKKKDKKDKKKKKKLRKDEIEHPDEPPPDPPVDVPPAKQPLTRQLSDPPHDESKSEPIIQEEPEPEPPKRPLTRQLTENKFKDSDKKHLLDADRLQVEKKEVEAKKKELSDRKKEIQNKKKTIDDPTERQNLDLQFKNVQSEWSQCSKRLAVIEDEIEKATKAAVPQYYVIYGRPTSYYDTLPLLKSVSPTETQLMKNSPASLRRGAGDSSDSRRSSGSSSRGEGSIGMTLASMTSPERECATSDMSLQEKIKRFQKK
ncbi:uncharacterized protein [Amphiura filiformis]|uniref:uncharacterized protein isoform X3 n=1 Tax=Amphiura filiformis TaxID=82378 RepID=UPI003B21DA30